MAILGKNVVLGYGDVGISTKAKGKVMDPTFQITFYQLDSPHSDPDPANADPSIVPISITTDLKALELLNRITNDLLNTVYDQQLHVLEQEKQRLQSQEV